VAHLRERLVPELRLEEHGGAGKVRSAQSYP
jgi:hypothetical protein